MGERLEGEGRGWRNRGEGLDEKRGGAGGIKGRGWRNRGEGLDEKRGGAGGIEGRGWKNRGEGLEEGWDVTQYT